MDQILEKFFSQSKKHPITSSSEAKIAQIRKLVTGINILLSRVKNISVVDLKSIGAIVGQAKIETFGMFYFMSDPNIKELHYSVIGIHKDGTHRCEHF